MFPLIWSWSLFLLSIICQRAWVNESKDKQTNLWCLCDILNMFCCYEIMLRGLQILAVTSLSNLRPHSLLVRDVWQCRVGYWPGSTSNRYVDFLVDPFSNEPVGWILWVWMFGWWNFCSALYVWMAIFSLWWHGQQAHWVEWEEACSVESKYSKYILNTDPASCHSQPTQPSQHWESLYSRQLWSETMILFLIPAHGDASPSSLFQQSVWADWQAARCGWSASSAGAGKVAYDNSGTGISHIDCSE